MHTTATTATSAGHTLPSRRRRQSGTELQLACGAAAALLFVLTFTVDGALRDVFDDQAVAGNTDDTRRGPDGDIGR